MNLPAALPHGEIEKVFDDIYFVTGTASMPGPLPVRFSRNMTIVRQGRSLTLINSLRLDREGLDRLDGLGKVEHVVRLAGFHGMDDPFYKDRYDAKVWALDGQVYARGFGNATTRPEDGYFTADEAMTVGGPLPIEGAKLIRIDGATPEGLLLLEREGGILVCGDCLQNWGVTDRYFSTLGAVMMRLMGFIREHNVGPGWLRGAKPNRGQVRALLDLEFEHVLPVHGTRVLGTAKEKYRAAINRL